MRTRISFLVICMLAAACGGPTPDEAYRNYNSELVEGLSFDEEKAFYTDRKKSEVDEQVPVYMESMGKERDEVIALYEAFSQDQARCHAIELVEERIDGETAYLEYQQMNTCGNEPRPAGRQKVRLIEADGDWKIDDIEVES